MFKHYLRNLVQADGFPYQMTSSVWLYVELFVLSKFEEIGITTIDF